MDDVVLITIDCWRYDAPSRMRRLSSAADGYESGSVICGSAATHGCFAAIFSSMHHPEAYSDAGGVRDDVSPLPEVLGEHGYSTGGFVASNPFLGRWSGFFDEWWNDGMSAADYDQNREEKTEDRTILDELEGLIRLQPTVPAEEIFERADAWWESRSSPKFLWVHLMEPHEPFLPGFDRGRNVGLLKSYISLVYNAKFKKVNSEFRDDVPSWMRRQLKELYYQCNDRLDSVLVPWMEKYEDDALVVATADHGEEFDHGVLRHARLYDETVRVPIYTNERVGDLTTGGLARQFDLAPTILDALDVPIPDHWEGESAAEEMPPQLMINSAPALRRNWVGVRSTDWKIIRPFDWDDGVLEPEAYDLSADPEERRPMPEARAPDELSALLDSFLERPKIEAYATREGAIETGLGTDVEGRLRELGYLE